MWVVQGRAVRDIDAATIAGGVDGLSLMERAGRGAHALLARGLSDSDGTTLVVCGHGNNGGDGLVVARELHDSLRPVVVLLVGGEPQGDAAIELERALEHGVRVERAGAHAADDLERLHLAEPGRWIVDALLGTGTRLPLREPLGTVVAAVASCGRRVFALDLPSGVDADTGACDERTARADLTATFGLPKWGCLLAPARARCGRIEVVDLEFDPEVVAAHAGSDAAEWIDGEWARRHWPSRAFDAHKYVAGSLLVVGGSRGMSGAVALACDAAHRAGAGLVEAVVPRSQHAVVDTLCVETLVHAMAETDRGGLSPEIGAWVDHRLARRDAVVVGCGLGDDPATARWVVEWIAGLERPAVIDADALNAYERTGAPIRLPAGCVLTPHSGELSRLIGVSAEAIEADRRGVVREAARELDAVLLHKGGPTFVAAPDGRFAVVGAGGPGLATAGSGDVLAGVIGALLAAGLDAFEAAALGAWWHGAAGDRLEARDGRLSVLARDLPRAIARVGRELEVRAR